MSDPKPKGVDPKPKGVDPKPKGVEVNEIEPYDEFEDIRKHHGDWEDNYG